MDRLILAFWIFLGGFGVYHTAHAAKSAGSVHAMDGGIFPPVSR